MGRPQGLKVCQLQFHSGFIPEEETLLSFNRSELDDVPDVEHVPNNFNLSLSVFVGDDERAPVTKPPWMSQQSTKRDAKLLFGSQLEYDENVDNFSEKTFAYFKMKIYLLHIIVLVSKPTDNNNRQHVPPPRPAPPVVHHTPLIDQSDYRDETDDDEQQPDSPPSVEVDFLNLGNEKPPVPEPPKIAKVKEPSFDLLGGFDSNFSDPFPDLVGSALNKPTVPAKSMNTGNGLDDIFGSMTQSSAPTIAPSKSSSDLNGLNLNFENIPTSAGAKQQESNKDPFADLAKTLHPEWSGGVAPKTTPSPMNTQYSTPIHQFGSSSASGTPKNNPSTPIHQMKSPSEPQRPDYSRSHFQEQQPQAAQKGKSADIFGDILGSQGYSFGSKTSQGPRSINEMRKVEQAQTMDPERLKVMEWVKLFMNFKTFFR